MSITLSRKDIIWSYFAQFFSIASGIITLPLILGMLSAEEIGMNYLMLTVGSLVSLFDFGFAPQFARNITYVFSGAQKLQKEGLDRVFVKNEVNYRLIATMIETAKYTYQILAVIVLFVMLLFGTLYIYKITNGFVSVNNSLYIWLIYTLSTFFNIYYSYYAALLLGKGLIKETKKAMVFSKIAYIGLTFFFLFIGLGLLGVSLANFIAPFVNRWLSYKYFFTKEFIQKNRVYDISKVEKIDLFKIIWFNSKKLGFISVSASSLNYLTIFILGFYLSLETVGSYGLMIQLIGFISTISMTLFSTLVPKMSYNFIQKRTNEFMKDLSLTIFLFYFLYLIGSVFLIYFIPDILFLIKSKTILPSTGIIILCVIFTFFEKNQSIFSQVLMFNNEIIFMKAAIYTAFISTLLVFLSLIFNLDLLGVVIAQGIPVILYSAWKWPVEACQKFDISIQRDIFSSGINQILTYIKKESNAA